MNYRMIALAGLVATGISSTASEWTEFRGPTGQGHSDVKNLPLKWSATQHVTWKTPVDSGWSSPVLSDGKIFFTTAKKASDGIGLHAVAVDEKTGRKVWDSPVLTVAIAKMHKKNSHASPTPIIENGRLYVHFGPNGTACLDLKGKVIWKQTSLVYSPQHGNGGSPILVDDKLIFNCDAREDPFIVALDKATGKVLWKTPRKSDAKSKFSFSTPLLIVVKGQKQVISPGSGVVYALNPDDGKIIWEVFYGQGYSVVPRPVYGHGMIYLSTGFNQANVLAIRPDGHGDVTSTHVAWKVSRSCPKTPSLLLVGDELYMVDDSGIASCLNAKSGEIYWSERLEGGGHSASPMSAGGRIYFQSEAGKTVIVKAGKKFEVLAENDVKEKTYASHAVADGTIYLRSENHLYKIQ